MSPSDIPAPADPAFSELGLRPELLATLSALGYEEPTPIQAAAIPPLVAGRDLLGQAATGTGKTAAFALPVLHRLGSDTTGATGPQALVLVPTRELAVQVSEAMHRYGRSLAARVVPIYGGQPIGRQLRALAQGVDVVVATPGRALDHIARGTLDLDGVRTVVLDEADEMLDMGFAEDIEAILDAAPVERQTVLFSATLPARIDGLARTYLRDPERIQIARPTVSAEGAPLVRQTAYVVARAHKAAALGRVLDVEAPTAAIVFCRTRDEVDALTETLNGRGYRAEALHGGMNQEARDRVMGRVRAGTAELLIATDVAARGLDIDTLTHVVNYDVPSAPEAYVHRIGRVGRAGRDGVAITLAEPREHRMLTTIGRAIGTPIAVEKLPTIADLRARRFELTTQALREVLEADDAEAELARVRVVVEALGDDFDLVEIALAAVKLAHDATGPEDDTEDIPDAFVRAERERRPRPERGGREAGPREWAEQDRPDRGDRDRAARDRADRRGPGGPVERVFIGMGRAAGVRPQDLVGAIANECGLSGREIGAIQIADRFALVEVPAAAVDTVIAALRGTTIKGKRPNVRRDRGPR